MMWNAHGQVSNSYRQAYNSLDMLRRISTRSLSLLPSLSIYISLTRWLALPLRLSVRLLHCLSVSLPPAVSLEMRWRSIQVKQTRLAHDVQEATTPEIECGRYVIHASHYFVDYFAVYSPAQARMIPLYTFMKHRKRSNGWGPTEQYIPPLTVVNALGRKSTSFGTSL